MGPAAWVWGRQPSVHDPDMLLVQSSGLQLFNQLLTRLSGPRTQSILFTTTARCFPVLC